MTPRRRPTLSAALILALLPVAVAAAPVAVDAGAVPRRVEPACEEGVVKDDGVPEAGYSWVPSVVEGIYVQEFRVEEFPSRLLEKVCLCWMRTGGDDSVDFDLVIYTDVGGMPAAEPGVVVPASVSGVPQALDGVFVEVELPGDGVRLTSGVFYIGARWNASVDQRLFLCADKSPTTPPVPGFFTDDRADGWEPALDTSDPIFDDYKALMIRAVAAEHDGFGLPATGPVASTALVLAIAAAAVLVMRRRLP